LQLRLPLPFPLPFWFSIPQESAVAVQLRLPLLLLFFFIPQESAVVVARFSPSFRSAAEESPYSLLPLLVLTEAVHPNLASEIGTTPQSATPPSQPHHNLEGARLQPCQTTRPKAAPLCRRPERSRRRSDKIAFLSPAPNSARDYPPSVCFLPFPLPF